MTDRLRFAVVGCGVIGPTHARAIRSLEDAELVAVADADRARAEKVGAEFNVPYYDDLDALLARDDLDVVTVCTPSGLHGDIAQRAMRSGRHVIIEKPLDITLPAIDEILRAERESGVTLAVISQHRFDPSSQQVHAAVQDGSFGRLVLGNAHIHWWRAQKYYDSGAWRGTRALDGGGVLMNQGIHSIDLLLWFMGPVRSVCAYTDTLAHRMETEDVAVAALRFESGAVGTITGTTAAYPGVATRIEVFGDRGSAVIENDQLSYFHVKAEGEEADPYGGAPSSTSASAAGALSDHTAIFGDTHAAQMADAIQAIREGRPPLVDGAAGRRAVELILAIYDSAKTGREVVLG